MIWHHVVMDLPDDLALPLERGAPWWYWTGGRPAIDFVNTLRERWRRQVETLVTDDDLAEWLVAARVLPEPPRVAPGLLVRARELREHIDAGMVAVIDGEPVPEATRVAIARELPSAVRPDELVREPDGTLALRPAAPERSRRPRPRPGRPRCGEDVHRRAGGAHPDLRVGHLQRPLLRPLARRRAPLLLTHWMRQRREGPPASPPARERSSRHDRSALGTRGRRRLRLHDRRARPRRRRPALPRRRHRGARRPRPVRAGLGPARRRRARRPAWPPVEPRDLPVRTGDTRADVQAAVATLADRAADRLSRDEQARDDLARISALTLDFVAQSARGADLAPVPAPPSRAPPPSAS